MGPESIVRGGGGGSNFDNVFLVDEGRFQIQLYADHTWPASKEPLNGVSLACR